MAQSYVYGAISDTEMGNGVEREAPDVHESCDSGKEHDRIELVSGSTTARPKTGGRKLTNIEILTLLAVYAILLFAVGIVLFGDWSSGNPESEFTFGEGYTMCLMLVSLVWMFRGPLKLAWVRKRRGETSKQSGENKETQVQSLLVKTLSLFAAVSLLFTFVQIIDVALLVGKCRTPVAICSDVVKLIFIPCQVCLIVYSKNKNLLQKSLFTGFMVMQIVVTNMILYIWTFIKSKKNFFPLAFQSRCPHVVGSLAIEIAHNRSTVTPNTTSSHCEPTIFNKLFPWFYPFCLEFCLTASAMLAEQLFESIRESALKERDTHETTNEDENRNLQLEIPVETTEVSVTAAVVIGIFALVAHFGVIGILTLEHNSNVATALWYGGEGITAMTITVASVVGLITLSKYQNSLEKSEVPIDEILIVLGSVGALTLSLFRGFPGLVDLGGDDRAYATGVLLCQMVVTLATILQTIFIVIALHSKSEKRGWINVASLEAFPHVDVGYACVKTTSPCADHPETKSTHFRSRLVDAAALEFGSHVVVRAVSSSLSVDTVASSRCMWQRKR
ncbi:uncharacterized protein LOC134182938 [Corticium candelabrum]|uniref:uncharacterized protein LOC134182938 n=1 Tax=Corticium candelabrum TaxID=121492 RepID=UPI002E264ECF|nr:uncharacterized protein LOC134182938 [Corticium candelabrum]